MILSLLILIASTSLVIPIPNQELPQSDYDQVEQKIVSILESKLLELYPPSHYKFEIELKRIPSKIKQLKATDIDDVSFLNPARPKAYERLRIHVSDDSYRAGLSNLAQVHIQLWEYLPLLVTPKESGQPIEQTDFRVDWFDTTLLSGDFITDFNQLNTNKVLSRMLKAGQPIRTIDLIAPAVVKAGDLIKVIMQKSGFQIEFMCTAREDGAIGGKIRCYSEDNRKTYSATILDNKQALWNATY